MNSYWSVYKIQFIRILEGNYLKIKFVMGCDMVLRSEFKMQTVIVIIQPKS